MPLRILVLFLALFLTSSLHARERPNIICLMAEYMSPDLGCYGTKAVRAPSLDLLAAEGLRSDNYRPALHAMRKLSLKEELNANEKLFFADARRRGDRVREVFQAVP